jgi:hypothetical protein
MSEYAHFLFFSILAGPLHKFLEVGRWGGGGGYEGKWGVGGDEQDSATQRRPRGAVFVFAKTVRQRLLTFESVCTAISGETERLTKIYATVSRDGRLRAISTPSTRQI